MSRKCSIAVDIMGGDNAPEAIIRGSIAALEEWLDLELHLVGPASLISNHTKNLASSLQKRIHVIEASEAISMNESPVRALRSKKDASIAVAARALQNNEVEGLFSAGPTGATIAAVCFSAQMLEGVKRPGIAVTFPGMKGPVVLCDVGANVSCRSVHLLQYAVMASEYCRAIHHIDSPRVALLTIGSEEGKGNRLIQDSHQVLKLAAGIQYTGLIEGHEVLTGQA
ncbi:MAG: phosphate acyltransferase PlsX, partial [Planctomycetota bacterium]|nr:phosphate acyltransferase PlsX [Planctomycetota bacterium]